MSLARLIVLCCGWAVALSGVARAAHHSFAFASGGHHLTVWYHRPADAPADAPVLIVIHGVGRNAEEYLQDWIEQADALKFALIVPEFSKTEFPGEESFNSGNLFDPAGHLRPREEWSFSMIEPVFDAARAHLGSTRNDYAIYGHSAGAQFVQRFLYFVPQSRATRAIAANAGWYMLPDLNQGFPYGLRGTPAAEAANLRRVFAFPLIVLLGEADTDSNHQSLRRTPEADEQGLYRFARGQFFFRFAQAAAAAAGDADFKWKLSTVPGVAHNNKAMAPHAARLLFSH